MGQGLIGMMDAGVREPNDLEYIKESSKQLDAYIHRIVSESTIENLI